MGSAAIEAGILMTEAIQLLILPHGSVTKQASSGSDRIGTTWNLSGRRQFVFAAPRSRAHPASPIRDIVDTPGIRLAALLRIGLCPSPKGSRVELLEEAARVLAMGPNPLFAPRWTGEAVLAAYENPLFAADAALSTLNKLGEAVRVAGHYGTMRLANDPFGGAPFLTGEASMLPARAIVSTAPGAVLVTEDFAAALCARSASARLEFVGELPESEPDNPTRLFSLKP
jgi:hypothetical protein